MAVGAVMAGELRGKISLVQSVSEIESKILKAIKPEVNKYLKKIFEKAKPQLIAILQKFIIDSPEYKSILNGELQYEFGLPDSAARLQQIMQFWTKLDATYNPVKVNGQKLTGGFTLNMVDAGYVEVLQSSASKLVTEKKETLNWLEWLLLFGNRIIIRDYQIEIGPSKASRTGKAIMKGVQRGKWSVPNQYAGTTNNNWITRAIDSAQPSIDKLFKELLK
jgi:hypothetical protein